MKHFSTLSTARTVGFGGALTPFVAGDAGVLEAVTGGTLTPFVAGGADDLGDGVTGRCADPFFVDIFFNLNLAELDLKPKAGRSIKHTG